MEVGVGSNVAVAAVVDSAVGELVKVGVKVGEAESGVYISVGAEVGVLNPDWEQASKNEERAAATPIVVTRRRKSCRLNSEFFLKEFIFVYSINPWFTMSGVYLLSAGAVIHRLLSGWAEMVI